METPAISASSSPLLAAMEENLHGHIACLQRLRSGMSVRNEGDLLVVDSGLACNLESQLRADGFEAAESELRMSMELSQLPIHLESPAGLIFRRAESREEIAQFAGVIAANWDPPDNNVITFCEQTAAVLLEPNCPMRLFVGYFDGQPVGVSEAFIGAGVAGIYSVATKKEYRGRGLGTALTHAAAEEAKRMGIPRAVLQSSNDGKDVYARLGFQPVCRLIEYTIAAAACGF